MSVARSGVFRSAKASLRHGGVRTTSRTSSFAQTQLTPGRRYASGGGDHGHAPSSDIPWLVGAVAVTIPSCWFLWPDTTHADAGHHASHDDHKEHTEADKEEPKAAAKKDDEEKAGAKGQEEGDDSSKDDGDKDDDKEESSTPTKRTKSTKKPEPESEEKVEKKEKKE